MTTTITETTEAALSPIDREEKALVEMLYDRAAGGSVEAAIFLLVNRHGYKTTGEAGLDA